jgi:hypothetical protein
VRWQKWPRKKNLCCGTVRPHRKNMPKDLRPKTLRLKRGDIRVRTRGDLTAVVWKDKRDVHLLTNIYDRTREGNYRDEHGNAIKPTIVANYNHHMGHVDSTDRMANSYMASCQTWKWTKKLFFHLLYLAIVNSYILLSSCGGKKVSHRFSTHWHVLGMSHDHLCLLEDQPKLPLTSEDWTQITINTGLPAIPPSSIVACVLRGVWRDPWSSSVLSVTWHFLWTEIVLWITTQKTTYKTSFRPSSMQRDEASTTT